MVDGVSTAFEDIEEFRRSLLTLNENHRRILTILVPNLVALQERGQLGSALRLIAEIKRLVTSPEGAPH